MSFIRRKFTVMLILIGFSLTGCQSTETVVSSPQNGPDNEGEVVTSTSLIKVVTPALAEQAVIDFSSNELSLAQAMYLSPNLYLQQREPLPMEVSAQYGAAVSLLNQGELTQAKSAFTQLTKQQPTLSGPWLKLGDIALTNDQPQVALSCFKKALNLNVNNYIASGQIARLLREQGDFTGAKLHYEFALKAWPGLASAHINLGILHDLYLGNKQAALSHYKLAQKLHELDSKPLNKELKLWILDVGRQIKAASKEGS